MYSTPSHICLINTVHDFSVRIKSSPITLSKSSPPSILKKMITLHNWSYSDTLDNSFLHLADMKYKLFNLACKITNK